ncbi:MAG: helix-turn-helix domain-containing protein [Silvania sp.]
MLSIVIEDNNTFYRQGMTLFLESIFTARSDVYIKQSKLTKENIAKADIIIKNFVAGESSTCQLAFYNRKKNSLVIGISEGISSPVYAGLPLCINDIVFIRRSDPLSKLKTQILNGWKCTTAEAGAHFKPGCAHCHHRMLSPQESKVAAYIFQGERIPTISQAMNIDVKTIYAHKHRVMAKFNLRSDYELFTFLTHLKNKKHPMAAFSAL